MVVGLATAVTSAATARRLERLLESRSAFPDAVMRYFRPGTNWAGRAIYGIPIFGFALLAMSQGAYSLRQGWVTGGLAIFVALTFVAEGMVWPTERRLQMSLAPLSGGGIEVDPPVLRDATVLAQSALVALVLLLVGTGLMVAQP